MKYYVGCFRSPSRPRATIPLTVSIAGLFVAHLAHAQEQFGVEGPSAAPPAPPGTEQAVVARYWELGRTRPFLAMTVDVGYLYVRPRVTAGYGRPFWSWIGVEAYPLLSLAGVGHYSGAAVGLPGLTLRGGARYFYPFSRSFLEPKNRFTRTDTELLKGPKADTLTYEVELTGTLPLFRGSVFCVLTGYRTALVPEGYYLLEESLRAVIKPPYVWRARLGYLLALSRNGAIRLGVASEVIGLPGRGSYILRGGLLGSVLIDARLEAQASFIPVIRSPDSLGMAGGDFGQLGVRLRWASDSRPPKQRGGPETSRTAPTPDTHALQPLQPP